MGPSRRRNNLVFAAALLALAGTSARADDLLVMPYACTMLDGQPTLRRARDEGHRVIGRREQRNFTACSPVNPDMCRQWTVYRFDLDCGGARVPWLSVVAAAARGQRYDRVWIEEGRLRLDMGPRWGMSPDDPCARLSPYDDRWRAGRLSRYCADRRALGDPTSSIVDMPPGFAPMLGIDGIFVAGGAPGAPNVAAAPSWAPSSPGAAPPFRGTDNDSSSLPPPDPPAKSARVEGFPPTPPEAAGRVSRVESYPPVTPAEPAAKSQRETPSSTQPEPAAKSSRVETPPPPSPAAPSAALPELAAKGARITGAPPGAQEPAKGPTAQEPAPPPSSSRPSIPLQPKQVDAKPVAPLAPSSPPAPAAASAPTASSEPTSTPGGPIVPKIINRPAPSTEAASPQAAPVTVVSKSATAEPAAKVAALPQVPPKEAAAPDRPAQPAAVRKNEETPATLYSFVPSPATGAAIAIGIGGLAALLLTAFALTRRRERAQLAGRPRRDFATVSFDGPGTNATLPAAPRAGDARRPAATPAGQAAKPAMPPSLGERIPITREEALQVLGMGVTADANLAAIKKIVDGLRASWHPDHAAGEADREMRELRMKQINAAWEIIAGKRAMV
jgi:hypothetical protein